jgi:hypothetical protein
MSSGSKPILQLKAAPLAEQLGERLDAGSWQGIEIALRGQDLGDEAPGRAHLLDLGGGSQLDHEGARLPGRTTAARRTW